MLTGIAARTPSASSTPRLAASQACLADITALLYLSLARSAFYGAAPAPLIASDTPRSHPNALTWPHHSSERAAKFFLSLSPAPRIASARFDIRSRRTCSARAENTDVKLFSLSLSLIWHMLQPCLMIKRTAFAMLAGCTSAGAAQLLSASSTQKYLRKQCQ